MKINFWLAISIAVLVVILISLAIYPIPAVKMRVDWRVDGAATYLRSIFDPANLAPTALPQPQVSFNSIEPVRTALDVYLDDNIQQAPKTTPKPLAPQVILESPKYEKEIYNNCGPATLTMALRMYGWEGNQEDISSIIKPDEDDKNVNIDELVYFVRNKAGWLNAEYRVAGELDLLKRLLSNGFPIIIESGMQLDQSYRVNDDRWAGHYLLVTGYNDDAGLFTTQDSWYSPNRMITYEDLDTDWKNFNRAYFLIYTPDQSKNIQELIGDNWDEESNRIRALNVAYDESNANPKDAFAWFNLGTNLLYFDRFSEAAQAYDTAIRLGLPQRMLRYQFGPFIAYFKTSRNADLKALAEYALKITPTSEENRLWYGWALYREGERASAIDEFNKALHINPNYLDARYALNFVGGNNQ
jgi:hypothetical protein